MSYNFINWKFIHVSSVSSTMDEIKKNEFDKHKKIALLADEQLKGRGTKSNNWISEKGNFFLSLRLNKIVSNKLFICPYIVGIVIYDVLKQYSLNEKKLFLKWPNDVFLNNKKIAGVLIETYSSGNLIENIVIGIGINLKKTPKGLEKKSTNLLTETKREIDRKSILENILRFYDIWEEKLLSLEIESILEDWMKRSYPINTRITFKVNKGKVLKGNFLGINSDGSIKIMAEGSIQNHLNLEVVN